MEKLKIIVGGYIGLYPTGGATWDYIQYPLGLKMLGHDVYYIEDTKQYPVFQKEGALWNDATYCIDYLSRIMERFGFKDKWAYRDIASDKSYGMTEQKILEVCNAADVFINISCSTYLRDEYLKIPVRVLIDSDPMFTQIQCAQEMDSDFPNARHTTKKLLDEHNFLFTFGENIGAPDCKIPVFDLSWHTTRQPVCLDLWENVRINSNGSFTSVMNWSGREKLVYENVEWGQKDVEFEKIKQVPTRMPGIKFEVVVQSPANKDSSYYNPDELRSLGWGILNPHITVSDSPSYRNFILASAAEFSVAKETYVKSNSGWFSCRSACYLAAGRPVITQETQWSKYIPSGNGLFAFQDADSAIDAIEKVKSDLNCHSKAAREIAHEYFNSSVVLADMLQQIK